MNLFSDPIHKSKPYHISTFTISTGKSYESRKPRKLAPTKWEIRSTYPLRENIWEYLYEDNEARKFNCGKKRRKHCKQTASAGYWKTTLLLVFAVLGTMVGTNQHTSVSIDCCQKLQNLAEELSRTEEALRHTLRVRRTMMVTWRRSNAVTDAIKDIETRYIDGATATKGSDTTEWGGLVALWGIIPLWRATPPPHTVLALRPPTPADCWAFMGSFGELILGLSNVQRVRYVSVEHVKPDTARSAPKHFVLYGVLANNTQIKVVDSQYRTNGPAKQYYTIANRDALYQSVVFRVLTNQGNEKYTCVYRVHLYGIVEDNYLV